MLHLICAHDPRGQSVFGFLLVSSERRMFLCLVFRCSARRRLKVLRSSRQQNQHFIPFKSEARKAENKPPSSSRRNSQLRVGVVSPQDVSLCSVAPRRLFHPPIAFTFPFSSFLAAVQQQNPAETRPNADSRTVKNSAAAPPPSNKPIQSAAQEEDRAATLRDLMSRQFEFNGDDD